LNLLFLLPYTPTPIRTRPYNFLRSLLRRGNQVTLATVYENEDDRLVLEEWRKLGATVQAVKLSRFRKLLNLLSALPSARPLQALYCWQPALMQVLEESWLTRASVGVVFEAVHFEHLRGAPFGLAMQNWLNASSRRERIPTRPPIVWDSVDCISLLFEKAARSSRSRFGRLATAFDLPRTRRYEGWLVRQFDHTLVTAEADRAALAALAGKVGGPAGSTEILLERSQKPNSPQISVVANGVDLEAFAPSSAARRGETIVLTGKMSYHANVTAALYLVETVMPQVWAARPSAVVQIVGANPPAEIRGLSTRYPGQVEVTGTVPDLAPYLQQAALAAAPIAYGVGIQNKVLEAMACATPVVCTPQAVSALATQPGRDLMVGDSASEFAEAILHLLADPARRESIGAAGRRYVEQCHSWDTAAAQLEDIYRNARVSATV
jgi:polysaccharide biosynthesis protein PslH